MNEFIHVHECVRTFVHVSNALIHYTKVMMMKIFFIAFFQFGREWEQLPGVTKQSSTIKNKQ